MIYLCQPTPHTGCSACCGLFNLKKADRKSLSNFLSKGLERTANKKKFPPESIDKSEIIRDPFSHICPYQGFIAEEKPGCLLHKETAGEDKRDLSLFGSPICGNFLCPAHYLLSDELKTELISRIDDWYLYSIAIIDPLEFERIYNDCSAVISSSERGDELTAAIKHKLEEHARRLVKEENPVIFHYSVSEYFSSLSHSDNK